MVPSPAGRFQPEITKVADGDHDTRWRDRNGLQVGAGRQDLPAPLGGTVHTLQYRTVLAHDPQRSEISRCAEEHVTPLKHRLRQGSTIGAGFDEDGSIGEAGD